MTSCSRCGSKRLFRFEPGQGVRVGPDAVLPEVCRDCGLTMVGGVHLLLPPELEVATKKLAIAAAEVGKETREQIMADPDARVEKYFTRVYERGYLDGFIRAFAFFKHETKEGRLARVKKLWEECVLVDERAFFHTVYESTDDQWAGRPGRRVIGMSTLTMTVSKAVYTEICKLLGSGDRHGPCSENQHSSPEKGPAPMP